GPVPSRNQCLPAQARVVIHARVPGARVPLGAAWLGDPHSADFRAARGGELGDLGYGGHLVAAPGTPQDLAEALHSAASRRQTIALSGNSSKRLMAGPVAPADQEISSAGLKRLLQYEPRDL